MFNDARHRRLPELSDGAHGHEATIPVDTTSGLDGPDLPAMLADASPEVLGRTVLAVATLHQADGRGRCRWCQPSRWRPWRRAEYPCPTYRVMAAELRTAPPTPQWTPA